MKRVRSNRKRLEKQYEFTKWTGFARPAVILVRVSYMYTSNIVIEFNGKDVNLKNQDSPEAIMNVISLGIRPGLQFNIKAEGTDEQVALQAIDEILNKMLER